MTAAIQLHPRVVHRLQEYLSRQRDEEAAGLREDITRAGARRQRKHVAPGKSREERREERNERAAEIREAVFARALGRCEGCRPATVPPRVARTRWRRDWADRLRQAERAAQ